MSALWLPRQTTWVGSSSAAPAALLRLLLQRDGPRPGFCWAQHKQSSIRKGENYDLFLPPGLLKAEYLAVWTAITCLFFSFQLVQGSCWDTTQVHFKRIQVMHNSLHPMRNCTDLKKKKNLLTFSNRNIPTKCFLLKYWRRRTSGLNSSIQGTHSSATTTRKHWIPFCKVRRKMHIVLVKRAVSNSSTDFP